MINMMIKPRRRGREIFSLILCSNQGKYSGRPHNSIQCSTTWTSRPWPWSRRRNSSTESQSSSLSRLSMISRTITYSDPCLEITTTISQAKFPRSTLSLLKNMLKSEKPWGNERGSKMLSLDCSRITVPVTTLPMQISSIGEVQSLGLRLANHIKKHNSRVDNRSETFWRSVVTNSTKVSPALPKWPNLAINYSNH